MANNVTGLEWAIDTASATPLTTGAVILDRIRWVSNGASAGDQLVIKDGNSKVVFDSRATGANYVEESLALHKRRLSGIAVTTLTSGTVYLYHSATGE